MLPKIIPTEIPAIEQNAWLKTSMFSLLYSFFRTALGRYLLYVCVWEVSVDGVFLKLRYGLF